MSLLSIVNCLDPILRKKCQPVENINDKLIKLSEDMIETMYEAGGLGLAANQVGLSSDLFVINISIQKEERNPIVIINPTIAVSEDKEMGEEGCLSIPDIYTDIKRAQRVEVKGYNLKGDEARYEAEGFLARAFQHEMDHLNGILFWDNLGKVKRNILKRKFRKKLKELDE